MRLYRSRPFWVFGNAAFGAVCLVMGLALGYTLATAAAPQTLKTYCNYRLCVRYLPAEDKEDAMLQQIIAMRAYQHESSRPTQTR